MAEKSGYDGWGRPDWDAEIEEFELQARLLGVPLGELKKAFGTGQLVTLSDNDWASLQNTESWDATRPGVLRRISKRKYGKASGWLDLSRVMDAGTQLDAPTVAKCDDGEWLCAGNTRLSVCRWRGVRPKVWAFDLPGTKIPSGHDDRRTGER